MASEACWKSTKSLKTAIGYNCAYCNSTVGAHEGFEKQRTNNSVVDFIAICPVCEHPTMFVRGQQMPGRPFGETVNALPIEVSPLYNEARNCMQVGAFTAAALLTRKLLMNVAVSQGATPGETFQFYVDFLSSHGFVPPKAKCWADVIRTKGNEATHEIQATSQQDAEDVISFMGMILKLVFEFPSRAAASSAH